MKGNLGGGGGFSSLDVGRRERRKKATASASRLFAKGGECTKGGLGGKYKSYEGMEDMEGEKSIFHLSRTLLHFLSPSLSSLWPSWN